MTVTLYPHPSEISEPVETTPRRPRITACMVWYDEPLESLERCIRSIKNSGAADFIVTSDGRWNAYDDGGPVASPAEQRHLVLELVMDLFPPPDGIAMETLGAPFESQVQKRARAYRTAAHLGDWVFVIDADEHVEACNPRDLRDELDVRAPDPFLVAECAQRTQRGPSAPAGIFPVPRLFSAARGLTVENSHNGVRTLDGLWLAGDPAYVDLQPRLDVTDHLRTFHAQGADRPANREQRDRRYRRARHALRLEGWPPRTARRA